MEKNPIKKEIHLRLVIVWIVSLLYYNAIEIIFVIDRLWHIEIYNYSHMDMRVAFVVYPVVAFITLTMRRHPRVLYYIKLSALCLMYSFLVVYYNIAHFPIKTWIVLGIYLCSIVICIWIGFKNYSFIIKEETAVMLKESILTLLISIAIIITSLCHAYLVR